MQCIDHIASSIFENLAKHSFPMNTLHTKNAHIKKLKIENIKKVAKVW